MSRMLRASAPALVLIGSAAALYLGYHALFLGLDRHDAGLYETVLARAAAGQIERGPGVLYGPFSEANPSVLMHAPLYYRLVALGAAVPGRLGLDPLAAALASGRVLTFFSTLAILAAAWRLARIDGSATARAGMVAAALVASSPILGVLSVMVRSDALGVALATWGCVLALEAARDAPVRRPGRKLAAAYAAFALAVCVKQQNVMAPMVCTGLLLLAWRSDRLRLGPIAAALAVGAGTGGAVLAIEEAMTGGLMRRAVFELPGGPFRAINYAGWGHVGEVLTACAKRSAGLVAVGLAGLWALRRGDLARRLDGALAALLAAECVALVPLCLYNKGSADNYALQAVVFAAVLAGRVADRALDRGRWPVAVRASLTLAALLLLANDARLIGQSVARRGAERAALAGLLDDPAVARCPPDGRYFVGDQSFNRLHGRRSLIHDEWLYGAFESIGEAEPRSSWLRDALTAGPVRQVVVPLGAQGVPGVHDPLPALGYAPIAAHGAYAVWARR